MLGALLPIMAAKSKSMKVPKWVFFLCKYFGSGVIVATAFIHVSFLVALYLLVSTLTNMTAPSSGTRLPQERVSFRAHHRVPVG